MRTSLIILPLLLCSVAAVAEPAPAQPEAIPIPPELTDPAMADRIANMMQVMSKAFLDLPAGELKAASEGRRPTTAEKRQTVRDVARIEDPNFDRNFQRQMANAKPMIEHSMKALTDALPAMMQGLQQAGRALERAAANMPDPTYPKR